jgi:hypothetical protein
MSLYIEYAAAWAKKYNETLEAFCRSIGINESNANRVTQYKAPMDEDGVSVDTLMFNAPRTEIGQLVDFSQGVKLAEIRSGVRTTATGGMEFFVECLKFNSIPE